MTVWCVWAGTTLVASVIVARHARRFPYSTDWDIVRVLSGERHFSWGYLWSPYTEHRLVVPRLVLTPLASVLDGDFRAGAWLNVLMLAGTSAVAVVATRRTRGHTSLADAFFPLVLLSVYEPGLTWGFHVHFTSVAVAAVGILLIMSRFGVDAPAAWLWCSVALMVVLFGNGGPGLALLPALLWWLVLSAVRLRRTARGQARGILVVVVLFVVAFPLYFIGLPSSGATSTAPTDVVSKTMHVLASTAGARADRVWPISGLAVAVALAATAAMLVARWRLAPVDSLARSRAVALLCFGGAVIMMGLAIGYGRGAVPWSRVLADQYAPLFVPVACWVFVAWVHSDRRASAAAGTTLVVAAALVYAVNLADMRSTFANLDRQEQAFSRDLCRVDVDTLTERHPLFLFSGPTPAELREAAQEIRALRRNGAGIYQCPG